MNRNQTILSIILGLTTILGGYALFTLLQLPDRFEWFQLYGLLLYIIIFAIVYILILTIIGFVIRFTNEGISKPVFKGTKWSILILIITIGSGILFGQMKVSETSEQMRKEWELQQQKDSTDYVNRLDSLNAVIQNDSKDYKALVERGLMKRYKGQNEPSIVDYRRALEIKPDDFEANLQIGYSLGLVGEKKQQDSFYRIAVSLDTTSYFAKNHPEYLKEE